MNALLDALAYDPGRRRRRLAWAAVGGTLVLAATLAAQRVADVRRAQLCTGGDALANEVWNAEQQRTVERSLLATGAVYAADSFRRTRDQIDDYMHRWRTMHQQTCQGDTIPAMATNPNRS